MFHPSNKTSGSEDTRRIALVFVGVIALAILVNLMVRPPTPPQVHAADKWHGLPNYMEKPEAASDYVGVLAARTGGDFTRLSPNEQTWLDAMTAGHGVQMLRAKARALHKQKQGVGSRQ